MKTFVFAFVLGFTVCNFAPISFMTHDSAFQVPTQRSDDYVRGLEAELRILRKQIDELETRTN